MRWWDGCYAAGDGCKYCFFHGLYAKRCGQNEVVRASNDEFYAPLDREIYKAGETIVPCLSSDFFIPEADEWRKDAWRIVKQRPDLIFRIITKRADRFLVSLPDDWGDGYDNVEVSCGIWNQGAADRILPLFLSYPIKHKTICCSPLIEKVDLKPYLHGVKGITVGGEWGGEAREFNFDWALEIREQCIKSGVTFDFWRTGQRFRKDGVLHKVSPYRKKAALKDFGIDDISVYIKTDIEKLLIERKLASIPIPDKAFLLAFDQEMEKIGYDFGTVIGKGTTDEPAIMNYVKCGTHNSPAVRVFVSEGRVNLKMLPKKLTPHFSYIESAPAHIKEIFTAYHENCVSCTTQCRTHKKYAIDGRFIQKCQPDKDLKPSLEYLSDYMRLFLEFFPSETDME